VNISFEEILVPDCFMLSELKARAIKSTRSPKTMHYRVFTDGAEIAFLSVDRWPEAEFNLIVVYEIFVPRSLRRKGIGSAVLAEIEQLATKEGFQRVHLKPCPLDSDITSAELAEWYEKRGYSWDPLVPGNMEKHLIS